MKNDSGVVPVTLSSSDVPPLTVEPSYSASSHAAPFQVGLEPQPESPSTGEQHCQSAPKLGLKQELEIFFSTFFTIFLAELGDKTQLTTLLMSAQSQSPLSVFLGAGAALVCTSLLGVLLGRWLACRLSPQVLETATGAILLLISALLVWDLMQM